MPIQVKDASAVAQKWVNRAGAAQKDYSDGVSSTQKDWATNTAAAANSYQQGVTDAVAKGRFAKGVNKAGTDKWKRKASGVGAQRYSSGVAAAQSDFATAIQPVLSVIQGLSLPPRGTRGAPQNNDRALLVQQKLHALRVGA